MKNLVIYHANCADGFCAAYLWWLRYPDSEFIAANYGDVPPDVTGMRVILLDFSYKREILVGMLDRCSSMLIIDHHKTAESALQGLSHPSLNLIFDMEKSGGRLTLEYLKTIGCKIGSLDALLVDYTEDRDLWRWKLPHSRAINANLASYRRDFEVWRTLRLEDSFIADGEAILRAEGRMIESIVARSWIGTVSGILVPIVNTGVLISEVGDRLCVGKPFSATYFDRMGPIGIVVRQWSLRSSPNGMDVSIVAAKFGGGGHQHAAGFVISEPL